MSSAATGPILVKKFMSAEDAQTTNPDPQHKRFDRTTPIVTRICVFPIESMQGISVWDASILDSGRLEYDKEFLLYDDAGERITGERNHRINLIDCEYDLENLTVGMKSPLQSGWQVF